MREIALRMSRAAAEMGRRIGQLIARSPMAVKTPLAQAQPFLQAMLDATAEAPIDGDVTLPIDRLRTALGLTPLDIDLVILAALADEHEGYASLMRALNPRAEPHATAGLAAQLTCPMLNDRHRLRETLAGGPIARAGLVTAIGDGPFFERDLKLADGLWAVLGGIDVYPSTLHPIAVPAVTRGLEEWLASSDVARARNALDSPETRLIVILAESDTAALYRGAAIAAAAGKPIAAFEAPAAASGDHDRLALVHALARGAVPMFKPTASDAPGGATLPKVESVPGPVIVCLRRSSAIDVRTAAPVMVIEPPPLPACTRERLWREVMPELSDAAPALAARYAIEPSTVAEIARDIRARSALNGSAVDLAAVADSVRTRCNLPASGGVRLVRPSARWEQLVLRPDRKALLAEALNRRLRQNTVLDRWKFLDGRPGARGVRVLLSGPPGTGKTLSAEVMAHALGVDLLVVDISRVVSKWIGETEKQLAQAFDAAERTQAVLLFDEADALFGKRTEVSDAHDRYANLETAFLLSRLEQFDGLAVLSTNLKQNIDPAFMRRLEFVVDLEEPTAGEREALWRCHLPAEAPLAGDVDLRELAALYPIVGGLIRNASVAAGFLAATADAPIGRHHLVGAIRREYDKSAKAFPGAPMGVLPA